MCFFSAHFATRPYRCCVLSNLLYQLCVILNCLLDSIFAWWLRNCAEAAAAPTLCQSRLRCRFPLVEFFFHTPHVTVVPENASNQTLQWSSSNEKVATVDKNGVIRAVSPGWAVITGKVTDGGWASVQINVNVPKTFVSATSIHLTDNQPVLFGCVARSGVGQCVGTSVTTSGVRYINERWDFGTTGDCFTLTSAKDLNNTSDRYNTDAELTWYYVAPTKAGQGTIRYIVNGSTVFSVSVIVDKTAVE